MMRLRTPALLLTLLLILTSGIGCDKGDVFKPVSEEKDENGWAFYRVPEDGFGISVPPDWKVFNLNAKTYENKKQGEAYATLLQQLPPNTKFSAAAEDYLTFKNRSAASVAVVRVRYAREITLEEGVTARLLDKQSLKYATQPVEHKRLALGEWFHYKAKSADGTTDTHEYNEYLYVSGADYFLITMNVSSRNYKNYVSNFSRIGESFRLIK
jgi:hypothetical protein